MHRSTPPCSTSRESTPSQGAPNWSAPSQSAPNQSTPNQSAPNQSARYKGLKIIHFQIWATGEEKKVKAEGKEKNDAE